MGGFAAAAPAAVGELELFETVAGFSVPEAAGVASLMPAADPAITQGMLDYLGGVNTPAADAVAAANAGYIAPSTAAQNAAVANAGGVPTVSNPYTTAQYLQDITAAEAAGAGGGITNLTAKEAALQAAMKAPAAAPAFEGAGTSLGTTAGKTAAPGMLDQFGTWYDSLSGLQKMGLGLGASMAAQTLMGKDKDTGQPTSTYSGPLSKFKYDPSKYTPLTTPQPTPYVPAYHAYAAGGPVEQMSDQNAIGANTGYPMADINNAAYATPYQQPISRNVLAGAQDVRVDPYTGEQRFADGGLAALRSSPGVLGGLASLVNRQGAPAPTTYGFSPALTMFRNLQAQRAAAPQMPSRPAPIDTYADYANQMAANRAALSRPAQAAIPVNPAAFSNYNTPAPAAPEMTGGKSYEGLAGGGLASLGSYSDGGRMLKGPGDGMSDDIPATIAGKQPARLANDEFVVPADVVSHLGNGSSDAGAKQLYKMMDRVRSARTGTKKQGKQINPAKYMPA